MPASAQEMKIVFLVSGAGGNLKFFHIANRQLFTRKVELAVIADRVCGAVDFAENAGLEHAVIDYSREQPEALETALQATQADIIVTNWNKIIDAASVQRHADSLVNLLRIQAGPQGWKAWVGNRVEKILNQLADD